MAQVDDHVKHIFREHNQEADHLANLGAEAPRKITIEKGENIQKTGRQLEGFCDGNTKTDGQSGCGVVIKGVEQVDHNQKNCCATEDLYGLGSGSYGSQCSVWHLGFGVGKSVWKT